MRSYLVLTENGPLLVLTSRTSITDDALLDSLRHRGIEKFIAYELDLEAVKERYSHSFQNICQDLEGEEDLRVLDFNGRRIFRHLPFSEFGPPYRRESHPVVANSNRQSTRPAFRPKAGPVSQSRL